MRVQVHVSGHRSGEPIEVPLVLDDRRVRFVVPGVKRSHACQFCLSFEELHEALVHLEDAAFKNDARKPEGARMVGNMTVAEPKPKAPGKAGA